MTPNEKIQHILNEVAGVVIGRGTQRDLPNGERTIPRCVTAFNAITDHKLSNEDGWLFMEILKLCRSTQGKFTWDDHIDNIGYATLRAEEALTTNDIFLRENEPINEIEITEWEDHLTRREKSNAL